MNSRITTWEKTQNSKRYNYKPVREIKQNNNKYCRRQVKRKNEQRTDGTNKKQFVR